MSNQAPTPKTLTRFDLGQRLQHLLLITSFTTLALTGLPQLFVRAGWAQALLALLGGLAAARRLHHLAGLVLLFVFSYHALTGLGDLLFWRARAMLPRPQDARDAAHMLGYLLGRRAVPPRFDRFDFRQKLEYWALMWGTGLMGATGLILMFPLVAAQFLPGVVVYAAKAAHGLEALLAILSIITWHMYNTHLAAGLFPLDTTIFTGRISEERMQAEHPLEYERLTAPAPAPPAPVTKRHFLLRRKGTK